MNTKRVIKVSLLSVAALVLIGVGPFVWLFTSGLRTPVRVPTPNYWPTDGWRATSPEEQGFDSVKLAEGLQDIQARQIDIDSLLIIRNGYVVLDAHFDPYDGTFPHDLASVTKSVTTTLIAIAADQGKLDLDAPVVSFFPERTIANLDDRKARLTVRHLTRMVGGMETDCQDDPATIDKMRANSDYVQAALDRVMVSEPGSKFCYDSPGMHILSAILQESTGMTALDFARQNLFEPLGIRRATWESDPQGYSRGWGDLHLLPEDAAKIGYLWLHRGRWESQQIVSEAWMLDSVKPHSLFVGDDIAYGNGWWISPGNYYASGRGEQKIHVISTRNTVIVTTGAGFEYDDINEWLMPLLLLANKSLPANPAGQADLESALAAAERGPAAPTAVSSPDTAQTISGKTYLCEDNAADLESLVVDFNDPKFATLNLNLVDADYVWPIGLDGNYRISPEGAGMRGYWKDSRTFLLETFDIGIVNRQMEIDGDHLVFSLPEADLTVTCQASSTSTWPISTPEEQGFDSAKLAEGLLAINEKGTAIHSLMILRNDRVILDAYFYPYDGSIYHDLASVTKSVMTTLIGIAADQGKLSLGDTMLSFFPNHEIANRDERKEKIMVKHLASMSSGMDCAPIDDELTLMAMRANEDWIQYALDLPMIREPGTRFEYCGTDMHLLSAILKQATGMSAFEFARENLFGPLGIQNVYWPSDPQGITHGWGDLCLHPHDMAKVGSLFLHNGQWEDQQIISREWVKNTLKMHMTGTGKAEDYGYGWWISKENAKVAYFLATGNGGQKIRVVPSANLILVTTGAGVEPSEIEPYIVAAMSDQAKPLPSNPAGVAKLNSALFAITQGPQPQPVPPMPTTARTISGRTFIFEPNRYLLSLRLDFDDPIGTEAIFQLEVVNELGPRVIGVGLDGVYRPSNAGRPVYARGSWVDPQTFVIDYNEGPGLAAYTFYLHFEGETLTFESPGLGRVEAKQK